MDDEPILHVIYKRFFSKIDCEIVGEAFNGEDAIEQINKLGCKPDLVIMDYRMPGLNGIETTIEILEKCPNITIIFVSADNTIEEDAIEAGAKIFVAKPFARQDIIDIVENSC